jgi:hypothetical protein
MACGTLVAGCLFPCQCIEPRPRRLPKREYFALWSDQVRLVPADQAPLWAPALTTIGCTRASAHARLPWLAGHQTHKCDKSGCAVTLSCMQSPGQACTYAHAQSRAHTACRIANIHGRKRAHACMHTQVRRHVAIHDTMSSCDSGRSQSLRRIHGLAAASAHSLTTSSHSRRAHRCDCRRSATVGRCFVVRYGGWWTKAGRPG